MSRVAVRAAAASRVSPADKWISRAAVGTVIALAGLAGAISYSHMRQLAGQHGQTGWHEHAFPLSVDGLEIVASLVLLAEHRSRRRPGWLPWTALVVGTAGSLAANVATAGPGTISQVIAGWPAVALLIAVKLLSSLLSRSVSSPRASDLDGQHEVIIQAVPISPSPPANLPTADVSRSRDQATTRATKPVSSRRDNLPARSGADRAGTGPVSATSLEPDVAELLPPGRAARDALLQDGQRVTRDALAARMREGGHHIRNSRLTLLLHALRSDSLR